MDQISPNLQMPYIQPAQAQKHVTHNEAIRALDALVQLAVADTKLAAPPLSPADGIRYIVAAGATAAWAGHAGQIAAFQDGAWAFYAPLPGWIAYSASDKTIYVYGGTAWTPLPGGTASVNPVPLVGVNATADATNRLSVNADASLFNNNGHGHQLKINKATAADTASILYQDGFSGRAEIGLAGDDNFHFKVSPDGTTWNEAMVINAATGAVSLPLTTAGTNLLINGDFAINQRAFSGGALAAGAFGHDRWKADASGASYSVAPNYTVEAAAVTLASGMLVQIIEPTLWGYLSLSSARITVSADNPSANLNVSVGSVSGTIAAGSGRRSVTLALAPGDNGTLAVKIASASGPATFLRVKAEVGAVATAWASRPGTTELALAQRYFTTIAFSNYWVTTPLTTTQTMSQAIQYPVTLRAVPVVTFANPQDSSASHAISVGTWRTGTTIAGSNATTGCNAYTTISTGAMTLGQAYLSQGSVTANAEL